MIRFSESIEKWLDTIESRLSIVMNQGILSVEGFTGVVGGPLFFAFLDRADSMAMGNDGYFLAKPRTFAKKYGFAKLYRVLPKGLELRQKVCEICNLWYFIYEIMNKILFVCHGRVNGLPNV